MYGDLTWPLGVRYRLYMLLKWLDGKNQSGKIEIPIEFLAELAEISIKHCYRLLKQCREAGLIRSYKKRRSSQNLIIYLRSHYKILRDLGYEKLPQASLSDNFFNLNQFKEESCTAASYDLQSKSRFKLIDSCKNKSTRKFIKDLMVLDRLSDRDGQSKEINRFKILTNASKKIHGNWGKSKLIEKYKNWPLILIDDRQILLGSTGIPYGTSQRAIAESLGCSISTVYRHQRKLEKRQIAKYDPGIGIINDCAGKLDPGNIPRLRGGNAESIPSMIFPDRHSIRFHQELGSAGSLIYESKDRDLRSIFKIAGTDCAFLPLTNFYLPSTDKSTRPKFRGVRRAYAKFIDENLKAMPYLGRRRRDGEKEVNRSRRADEMGNLCSIEDKNQGGGSIM